VTDSVADLGGRAQQALQRHWPQLTLGELRRLPGGISSLTFSAAVSLDGGADAGPERLVVVKVAPPGLPAVRNRDVLRQARVIKAVGAVPGVRVPAVLAEDDGSPPLFVMEHVDGESYEPRWDVSASPPDPVTVSARARAAARMLARLHSAEPAQLGLADEPALEPEQELARWARLYETAGDDLRGAEATLRDALAARTPRSLAARVLHGDYRLGNMQFAGQRLAAIIDWEIWSLGDPRADLAWLMVFCDPVQERVAVRDHANQAAAEGMPRADELLGEYLDEAGFEAPADLAWFMALGHYKLAATMAVLAKRNRRSPTPDPTLERAAQTTPAMLAHALELLAR
jgi:aminoglycoside phosphotransferase (APT) family kinase protein